jgi:hypothetical protein
MTRDIHKYVMGQQWHIPRNAVLVAVCAMPPEDQYDMEGADRWGGELIVLESNFPGVVAEAVDYHNEMVERAQFTAEQRKRFMEYMDKAMALLNKVTGG